MKVYYRIYEINPAYDHILGKGKGWIYCTNHIKSRRKARLMKIWLNATKEFKHKIDKMQYENGEMQYENGEMQYEK